MASSEKQDNIVGIHDVFGVKPIGEATQQVTKATIDGVSSFLRT
jgi:hypothetical protein